jgi:acetyl esterase/lipase
MNPGRPTDLSPHGADPHPVGPVGGAGQPPGLRDPRLGVHPPFDPELAAVLAARPQLSVSLLARHIPKLREAQAAPGARLDDTQLCLGGAVLVEETSVAASESGVLLPLLVLRPAQFAGPRPAVVFFHGGGMVAGDNRSGIEVPLEWVVQLGMVVLSVGYRLAPEHPHPVPVEDCYAALCAVAQQRAALDIDTGPLMVAGVSSGGGLAAGVALLARDRGGPQVSDQILMCPMLDDQARFHSSGELLREGTWDARSNKTGWEALLGAACGTPQVPPCAAPSRAASLAGLPAAYLDVGAVETFRDEVIDYAARLAQEAVSTELHVWAGAFHGFDVLAPGASVSRAARAARIDYLRRRLGGRTAK